MLLLPKAPRTATVAEIVYTDKSVSIRFPEKNDLKQNTGIAVLFKDHTYSTAWEPQRGET